MFSVFVCKVKAFDEKLKARRSEIFTDADRVLCFSGFVSCCVLSFGKKNWHHKAVDNGAYRRKYRTEGGATKPNV